MFVVTVINPVNGEKLGLRSTVWAMDFARATRHPTREAAQTALDKAKPFMQARLFKAARIEQEA